MNVPSPENYYRCPNGDSSSSKRICLDVLVYMRWIKSLDKVDEGAATWDDPEFCIIYTSEEYYLHQQFKYFCREVSQKHARWRDLQCSRKLTAFTEVGKSTSIR
jgi:hypothetical protein